MLLHYTGTRNLTRLRFEYIVYSREEIYEKLWGEQMKITLNPDKEVVKTVKEGLKRTGGYCPCRIQRTEEYKCMCKEFKEQIADPDFEGFCHCMLYYKSKD